jgi:hypothetical protein
MTTYTISTDPGFRLYAINFSRKNRFIFHISAKRNGTWLNVEYEIKEIFTSTITIKCVKQCGSTLTLRFNDEVSQYVRV